MKTASRLLSLLPGVLLLALFAGGCPGPEWPKCENDEHCQAKKEDNPTGKDYMCVFGQCQECAKDPDCGAGQRCNQGRCEAFCTSDDQCGEGQTCNPQGDCVQAPTTAKNTCVENGDCKSGFTCQAGTCVEDTSTDLAAQCEQAGRVQFEFNVYDLTPEARETLTSFADCLKSNAAWKLTIEGHADERGTTQYNLDLGEKRARAVQEYLADLGIEKKRIKTISYGEERPLESRSDEDAWAKNRRGELIIKLQ